MKTAKTFRLSDEAVAKLDSQENATAFLEDLIMGRDKKVPWLNLEFRIDELKNLFIYEIGKLTEEKKNGLECCKGHCNHWVYNMDQGALVNVLTGELRDAEE